jgi:rhodanese-related sulfurtransferase
MADIKRISPQEANEKMKEGFTYVDVRTTQEYEAGHPEGAVNVPIFLAGPGGRRPNPEFTEVMNAAFPKDAKLIFGCSAGGRSLRAAQMLVAEGFTNVLDQRAGWDGARDPFGQIVEEGWSRVGLPTESGAPAGRAWPDMQQKAT